jgi:surface polysaccharide O-acyltransferase-like enzyme
MGSSIKKEQMDYFWKKREFVYFILSVLVFLIHISSFAQYPVSEGIISSINTKVAFFFKESITRFAVPMYFILSGMLFSEIIPIKNMLPSSNPAFLHYVSHI